MIFLISHDWKSTIIERFANEEEANKKRLALELESKGTRLIFTLDAKDETAVRKTHGRYFQ